MGKQQGKPNHRLWKQWIDRISQEMVKCACDRYVFNRWWSIIRDNPAIDINNTFLALIWSSYFQRQVMAIRRQVKINRESISLVRLLKDIAEHDIHITRQDFLRDYVNPHLNQAFSRRTNREASKLFDSLAGRGRSHVSGVTVRKDIERLKRAASRLERYADKWVAHSDRKRRWPRLSFKELNKALDVFLGTWHRYHNIAWRGPVSMDPASMMGTEWEKVLTVPWKHPSHS